MEQLSNPNPVSLYERKASHWQLALKYGIIFAMVQIALQLVFYILGMKNDDWYISLPLNIIANATVLYLGMVNRRNEQLGGFASYGQMLGTGTYIALFGALIICAWNYIFFSYIDTETLQLGLAEAKKRMIEKNMGEEDIEKALAISAKFSTPGAVSFMALFMVVFFGFLYSLLVAIFTKKDDPDSLYSKLDS